MSVWIKICGVRRWEDLEACVEAGADAVGFNFWPGSKRYLAPAKAKALVQRLPRTVLPVGVFVLSNPDAVARAVADSGVRAAQLHGGEDPSVYKGCAPELIQVFRVSSREDLPKPPLPEASSKVLLDAAVESYGGSGQSFDWSLALEARRSLDRPMILAGGLTLENVAAAVRDVAPFGVDVASGVEREPGNKDAAKIRAFIAAARSAARGEERNDCE